jgi:hypothetical protein
MGVITESLINPGHIDENVPTMVVSQLTGRIHHANEACRRLLRIGVDNLDGINIREILSVDLPPPTRTEPEFTNCRNGSGKWHNRATTELGGHERTFNLEWKPVQLEWVSYWMVTLTENLTFLRDNESADLAISAEDRKVKTFGLPDNYGVGLDNWQLMTFHRPVGHRGGDVLYIEEISPDYLFYFLGDVAGHHKDAEIVRLMLTSYLKMYREDFDVKHASTFPGSLLTRMNSALYEDEHNDCLLTGLVLLMEKHGNRAWFASAGHQPIFLIKPDEGRSALTTPDIPLGIRPKIRYRNMEITCDPRDRLLCFTDGLITKGSISKNGNGLRSLLNTLDALKNDPVESLAHNLQRMWSHVDKSRTSCESDVTFTVISRDADPFESVPNDQLQN